MICKWTVSLSDTITIGEIWSRDVVTFLTACIGKRELEKFGDRHFSSPKACFQALLKIIPQELHPHIAIYKFDQGKQVPVTQKDLP